MIEPERKKMLKEIAEKVEQYFDAGYCVIIDWSGYVDTPVSAVYLDESKDEIVYDSETFSGQPLSEIGAHCVKILKPIKNPFNDNLIDELEYRYEEM